LEHLLGAHTSIRGGVANAVDLAVEHNFNTMQIFTKNNNRWAAKPLTLDEVQGFRQKVEQSHLEKIVAHDSYLINLCATDKEMLKKSGEAFVDELTRCELLGIPYLNFHPGAHGGAGEEAGIKIIADSINKVHQQTKDYTVSTMLELTAGQGSAIGYRFEHLAMIIELIDEQERMSVCIDTAHLFAAGYDFRTPETYAKTFKEFDEIIGLNRLKCFHINDSKKDLGSRVDRHEHIGKGKIGLEGFRLLMNDKRFSGIPKILETPKGKEMLEDIENLNTLRSLIQVQGAEEQ
jgi:deoxyribonuclease IV